VAGQNAQVAIEAASTAASGRWLLEEAADWWDLVRFGPPGHEVYVRVAFDDSPLAEPRDTVREALDALAGHTATRDAAYAAVWEGWTGSGRVPAAPVLPVPNRTLLLFTASVAELRDVPEVAWHGVSGHGGAPPHLAWPEDRAWCLACEVDEEIEFTVGCSRAAADALAAALPGHVREVAYGEQVPLWRE